MVLLLIFVNKFSDTYNKPLFFAHQE